MTSLNTLGWISLYNLCDGLLCVIHIICVLDIIVNGYLSVNSSIKDFIIVDFGRSYGKISGQYFAPHVICQMHYSVEHEESQQQHWQSTCHQCKSIQSSISVSCEQYHLYDVRAM